MKKILVTPAGRERYMDVLFNNLIKRKKEFDEWHIWLNTEDENDISYLKKLEKNNSFITCIHPSIQADGSRSIYSFFKNSIDKDSLYLRLDDDVIYVEKDAISKMFKKRQKDDKSFLLYGNIINNAVISREHQKNGLFSYQFGNVERDCMDAVGWNNPFFAKHVHDTFIEAINNKEQKKFYIEDFVIDDFTRVSINVISWRGIDFLEFDGNVGHDEERWLSVDKPMSMNRPNKIVGNALFSHFAFFTQRDYLDSTDLLEKYKAISLNNEL